ncbi:hypothetical protein Nepgr_012650 [Nepenthes gracilis]|uniref:Uncharacterized protein n=1 Tax=Nepenthes gracilis TaxID=150966 RepID=A0AAD3SHM5_NEPGR|nr:hypothetical protein Nepgr_012650 [Nepenthes gracilis]
MRNFGFNGAFRSESKGFPVASVSKDILICLSGIQRALQNRQSEQLMNLEKPLLDGYKLVATRGTSLVLEQLRTIKGSSCRKASKFSAVSEDKRCYKPSILEAIQLINLKGGRDLLFGLESCGRRMLDKEHVSEMCNQFDLGKIAR